MSEFTFKGIVRWVLPNQDGISLLTVLTRTLLLGYTREGDTLPREYIKLIDVSDVSEAPRNTSAIVVTTRSAGKTTLICRNEEDTVFLRQALWGAGREGKSKGVSEVLHVEEYDVGAATNSVAASSPRRVNPSCPLHGLNSPLRQRTPMSTPRHMIDVHDVTPKEWEYPTGARSNWSTGASQLERRNDAHYSERAASPTGGGYSPLGRFGESTLGMDQPRLSFLPPRGTPPLSRPIGGSGSPLTAQHHTVRAGESIAHIAELYRVSVDDVREANAHQSLLPPRNDSALPTGVNSIVVPTTVVSARASLGQHHAVKSGESIAHIAEQYGVSADDIREANAGSALPPRNDTPLPMSVNAVVVPSVMGTSSRAGWGRAANHSLSPVTGPSSVQQHAVRPGDLASIAQHYGVRNDASLPVGISSVAVPGGVATPSKWDRAQEGVHQQQHAVRPGESLSAIASRYGVSTDDIRKINPEEQLPANSAAPLPSGVFKVAVPLPGASRALVMGSGGFTDVDASVSPLSQRPLWARVSNSLPQPGVKVIDSSVAPLPTYVEVPSNVSSTNVNPSAVWRQWTAPNGDTYYGNERTGAVLCRTHGSNDVLVASPGSDPNAISNMTANPDTTPLLDMNNRKLLNIQNYGKGDATKMSQETLPAAPTGPGSPGRSRGTEWGGLTPRGSQGTSYSGRRRHTITIEGAETTQHTVSNREGPSAREDKSFAAATSNHQKHLEHKQQWEHIQHILMRGRTFVKHHLHSSFPSYRHVYLSQCGNYLCWVPTSMSNREKDNVPHMQYYGTDTRHIPTSAIVRVSPGANADGDPTRMDFRKMFSVMTNDRLLQLECQTMEEAQYWVDAWNAYLYYSVPGAVPQQNLAGASSPRVRHGTSGRGGYW